MLKLAGREFRLVASSGALGWAGRDEGHGLARAWKWPFRLLGLLRSEPFLTVVKTLTAAPCQGRLTPWRPWRAVRLIPGGTVNAVALTNPGLEGWLKRYAKRLEDSGLPAVASLAPETPEEAAAMVGALDRDAPFLLGYELNPSCANVGRGTAPADEVFGGAWRATAKPVGVKFGHADDWPGLTARLDGKAAWFHLINAPKWADVFPGEASPLARYGYDGAVSGRSIARLSRAALRRYRFLNRRTPVVSGGGVMTAAEAEARLDMGADAVGLGCVFLRAPWRPLRIARAVGRRPAGRPA